MHVHAPPDRIVMLEATHWAPACPRLHARPVAREYARRRQAKLACCKGYLPERAKAMRRSSSRYTRPSAAPAGTSPPRQVAAARCSPEAQSYVWSGLDHRIVASRGRECDMLNWQCMTCIWSEAQSYVWSGQLDGSMTGGVRTFD
jgi:hypothetical protein